MNNKPVMVSQLKASGEADFGGMGEISRAELDIAIATAKQWPRDLKSVMEEVRFYATMNVEAAELCYYSLPRKKKNKETGKDEEIEITGPSIRFAEILAHAFGNCRFGARIIRETDKVVVAQGAFFDVQRNVGSTFEVQRGITYSSGGKYNNDMVAMTGNAAGSIALRNAVIHGIPRALWWDVYQDAFTMAERAAVPLTDRWKRAVEVFAGFKVTEAQLLKKLGVADVDSLTAGNITTLVGWRNAIKDSQATVEELFAGTADQAGAKTRTVSAKDGEKADGKSAAADKQDPPAKQHAAAEERAWTEVEGELNNALLDAETVSQVDEVAASFEDAIVALAEENKPAAANARDLIKQRRATIDSPANDAENAAADRFPGDE